MKPNEVERHLSHYGWAKRDTHLASTDGSQKATFYHRDTPGGLFPRETILLLEVDGEVQVFRASHRAPLHVLAGKVPPA